MARTKRTRVQSTKGKNATTPKRSRGSPELNAEQLEKERNKVRALKKYIRRNLPHILSRGEIVLYGVCQTHNTCTVVEANTTSVVLKPTCDCDTGKSATQRIAISYVHPMRVLAEREYTKLLQIDDEFPPGAAREAKRKEMIDFIRSTKLVEDELEERWERLLERIGANGMAM
jgi:hypothetical protein